MKINYTSSTISSHVSTPVGKRVDILGAIASFLHLTKVQTIFVLIGILLFIIILIVFITWFKRMRQKAARFSAQAKGGLGDPMSNVDFAKFDSPYGFIDLNITYDKKGGKLKLSNMTAMNFPVIGVPHDPDCYIFCYIPEITSDRLLRKQQKKRTKTVQDNYCPLFNDSITFMLPFVDNANLNDAVVAFQLFDENQSGNDNLLGEGVLCLSEIDLSLIIGRTYPYTVILGEPKEIQGIGDICLILTVTGRLLRVTILEAKNIRIVGHSKLKIGVETFCHVTVFVKGKKRKTFETGRCKEVEFPYFKESFSVKVTDAELERCYMKLEVFVNPGGGKLKKTIGKAYIGIRSEHKMISEIGEYHLKNAIDKMNNPVVMWHSLVRK